MSKARVYMFDDRASMTLVAHASITVNGTVYHATGKVSYRGLASDEYETGDAARIAVRECLRLAMDDLHMEFDDVLSSMKVMHE